VDLQRHQVLEKLQLMEPWLPASPTTLLSMTPPGADALPEAMAAQLRAGMVVVHVPSMWRYKQWPTAHYRRVVERLLEAGLQVVLTGAPSDHDRALVGEVRDVGAAPSLIDACGELSFAQLTTLLARADGYLGPDTSVTHLAAAVGLPIVTVFGPTAPTSFGPWPRGHAATQPWAARAPRQRVASIVIFQGPDLPGRGKCVPCGRSGCEDHQQSASHCLDHLEPERVAAQLLSMVKLPAAPPPPAPFQAASPWKPAAVSKPP
jgi:heptosyltransferase-3